MNPLPSERAIRDGYWYHRRTESFPPTAIRQPKEYDGSDRVCISCTQTSLPPVQQKKLIEHWCELLPTLSSIRTLWFSSKVPQRLFDAACAIPSLEGLYIKWSGIKDLRPITHARSLRFLHLGSSTQVDSIEPLGTKNSLLWLELENIKRISNLTPIAPLRNLVGLAIEGAMWTPQQILTLAPLRSLTELQYLSIINVKVSDSSLRPLHALSKLQTFRHALWWSDAELNKLYAALPQLHKPA
jgi:hypothetical protein